MSRPFVVCCAAAAVCLVPAALPQPATPSPCDSALAGRAAAGPGRYCLVVEFREGKVARSNRSAFSPGTSPFPAGAAGEIEKLLDAELAKLDKPYVTAIDPSKPLVGDEALRAFTGTFADYFAALVGFCSAQEDRCLRPPDMTLSAESGIFREFSLFKNRLPLLFTQFADPEQGIAVFEIPPPFDAKKLVFRFPNLAAPPVKREGQLRKWLSSLNGHLWQSSEIRARVVEFYDTLGLDAFVLPQAETMSIEIDEARLVRRIVFRTGLPVEGTEVDWSKAEKALYSVLPDQLFRRYVSRREAIRHRLSGIAGIPSLEFQEDLQLDETAPQPFNSLRIPVQQLLLQQVGFSLDVAEAGSVGADNRVFRLVDLKLLELSETTATEGLPPPTPALTDPRGHVQAHAAETSANPSLRPRRPAEVEALPEYCCSPAAGARPKNRYAGFGGQYAPGQGLRLFGLTQAPLPSAFGQSSVSIRGGQAGPGQSVLSGSFFSDYLLFERLHRRMSVQFQGGADSQVNRILGGRQLNERRLGALGRFELEFFRSLNGQLLKVFTEVRRETVGLGPRGGDAIKTNLSALDIGGVYLFESSGNPYPWTLRWEPTLRLAPKVAGNQDGFGRAAMALRGHKALPGGFALDAGARFERASARTPLFELPSLGGAESLRGFRRDDALGTGLWSIQPELWSPVRLGSSEFVRKSLKLAMFLDAGNVSGGIAPKAAARVSPGLGLRILYGPAVIRADWAYGLGQALTGGSRGKFNFSVTTNLPI